PRRDPEGHDGFLHPPAMFSLGADRGTLYYARQPPFCRRCMAYGHILASCDTRKCRYCGSGEHEARDCKVPKACHGCGSSAHLWRECPAMQRSYAHCRSFGHVATGCNLLKCRNCGKPGHGAANCREARVCNGCGKQGHLFIDCPNRQRTYAEATTLPVLGKHHRTVDRY
uniref:CCHC-type domain-containing protein n=1 Tax=Oncorhynchus mykiss TaxID=8022 RepID=A0A8C7UAM1_ONCMY